MVVMEFCYGIKLSDEDLRKIFDRFYKDSFEMPFEEVEWYLETGEDDYLTEHRFYIHQMFGGQDKYLVCDHGYEENPEEGVFLELETVEDIHFKKFISDLELSDKEVRIGIHAVSYIN